MRLFAQLTSKSSGSILFAAIVRIDCRIGSMSVERSDNFGVEERGLLDDQRNNCSLYIVEWHRIIFAARSVLVQYPSPTVYPASMILVVGDVEYFTFQSILLESCFSTSIP